MTDNEVKAQRSMKHKLKHRAATLRKVADELDAIAAQLDEEDREPASVVSEPGPPS